MSVTVRKLSLKSALSNSKFKQLVFIVCIASAVIVYFLLTRIDVIVHEELYNFGLLFSTQWVEPYRALMWSIYGCLCTSVVLSGIVLASDFLAKKQELVGRPFSQGRARKVTAKLLRLKLPVNVDDSKCSQGLSENLPCEDECSKVSENKMYSNEKSLHVKNSTFELQQNKDSPVVAELETKSENRADDMLISCPKCKKIFKTPLVMLDFSCEKPGLMNVCPYCNQVLGSSEAENDVYCDLT
jgi:uncharacterized Zn-finger protein